MDYYTEKGQCVANRTLWPGQPRAVYTTAASFASKYRAVVFRRFRASGTVYAVWTIPPGGKGMARRRSGGAPLERPRVVLHM